MRLLDMFRTPTAAELAKKELEETKRALLEAQSAFEYAGTMVDYHTKRIRRLQSVVTQTPQTPQQ